MDLQKRAGKLRESTGLEFHPIKRLIDAIRTAGRRSPVTLERQMMELDTSKEPTQIAASSNLPGIDSQVTLGARLVQIKVQEIMLRDQATLLNASKTSSSSFNNKKVAKNAKAMLGECRAFIALSKDASLVRYTVQAILAYARVAYTVIWSSPPPPSPSAATPKPGKEKTNPPVLEQSVTIPSVRAMLKEALALCSKLGDGGIALRKAVKDTMRLSEKVTPEELASIKSAMVSGPGGLATHIGHWYNCVNGHPVSSILIVI
jgi:hypothetical protein